jgi:RimJ/RimL family protein N-acetyltransferase
MHKHTYKCLSEQKFEDTEGYALVPIREQDMESIRLWRNGQLDVLRQQHPISGEQQREYYHNVVAPLFQMQHPPQILFSFLKDGECIGYGGLTYLDWAARRGEISFLLDTERSDGSKHYKIDYLHFLELLKAISFKSLHLHRIFAETFGFRKKHMAILEEAGFHLEGRLRDHIFKQGKWYDSVFHGLLVTEYYGA